PRRAARRKRSRCSATANSSGRPRAAGVVLVHGAMHGSWCWEPTIPYLAGRVIAGELPPASVRGEPGRHTRVPELETLTVDDFAQAVLAAVDRAALDRFVLVGHSLGGVAITDVATRYQTASPTSYTSPRRCRATA